LEIIHDFNYYPVRLSGGWRERYRRWQARAAPSARRIAAFPARRPQWLLAPSDSERLINHEFCAPASLPVAGLLATLRAMLVVAVQKSTVLVVKTPDPAGSGPSANCCIN
jgi:hypothetical protein